MAVICHLHHDPVQSSYSTHLPVHCQIRFVLQSLCGHKASYSIDARVCVLGMCHVMSIGTGCIVRQLHSTLYHAAFLDCPPLLLAALVFRLRHIQGIYLLVECFPLFIPENILLCLPRSCHQESVCFAKSLVNLICMSAT